MGNLQQNDSVAFGENELAIAFTGPDIRRVISKPESTRPLLVYLGMDRDHELEATCPNVFYAQELLNFDTLAAMRPAVIDAISKLSRKSGELWHTQNAVFSAIVQYIAMLAASILALRDRFSIRRIVVFGQDIPSYMPVQEAEHEVVRRFEWFPEHFYPRYVAQIAASLEIPCTIVPSAQRRFAVRARAKYRATALDTGKAIFLLRRNFKLFGVRALGGSGTMPLPPGPIDTIVFLRSLAGVDFLKYYVRWLTQRGRKVVLIVGEQLQRTGTLSYVKKVLPDVPSVHLPLSESPLRVMTEYLRRRFQRPPFDASTTISLQYGPAKFRFEIGAVAAQLFRGTCDQRVYECAIKSVLEQLGERRPVCVSAEIMTYYPSVEAEAAYLHQLQYWNTEPGPFDKRYALRVAPGTGYAVQSCFGESAARAALPWEAQRIHHLGCLAAPWLELRPRARRKRLGMVVFFTHPRPGNTDHNFLIGEALIAAANEMDFSLVIKAHPRDFYDYRSRWSHEQVRIADRLEERSENLTRSADCVVASASSTLAEALHIGTPYISILLEEQFRAATMESLSPELGVRHYSIGEMLAHLRDFARYSERYYQRRAEFLERNLRIPLIELGGLSASRDPSSSSDFREAN